MGQIKVPMMGQIPMPIDTGFSLKAAGVMRCKNLCTRTGRRKRKSPTADPGGGAKLSNRKKNKWSDERI